LKQADISVLGSDGISDPLPPHGEFGWPFPVHQCCIAGRGVRLLDNLGFGAPKTFGGVMNMATLDRLAKDGVIYTNFHTAPLCSPSRMALLTGRNPHSVNMGSISEFATAFPGQTSVRPNSKATLPEILKLNGYSTAMFGKAHEFTPWETGLTGPFDQWPTGNGFERFYGNVSGETDLFAPVLHDNLTPVDLPQDPNTTITDPRLAISIRSRRL
jgi:arylsulfatase